MIHSLAKPSVAQTTVSTQILSPSFFPSFPIFYPSCLFSSSDTLSWFLCERLTICGCLSLDLPMLSPLVLILMGTFSQEVILLSHLLSPISLCFLLSAVISKSNLIYPDIV